MGGGFYLFRDFGCRKADGLFGWDYLYATHELACLVVRRWGSACPPEPRWGVVPLLLMALMGMTSAKKGFSPGATVVASGRKRCALSFLLASTAHTWSQHPGCAQEPPEQHHMDGIHLLHPEGQLGT